MTQQQKNLLLDDLTKKEFGYSVFDLSRGSKRQIYHKCIVCNEPKKTIFRYFVLNKTISHFKCKNERVKQTCLEKYGVDNPQKSKQIKDKTRQTCLKKYGVEYALSSKQVRKKIKQTCLEKYDVEHSTQAEVVKKKKVQTFLEKYQVDNPSKSEKVKRKKKQVYLAKYGVDNPQKSKQIREKTKKTNLQRRNVEYPMQSGIVLEKRRENNLQKYGHITKTQYPVYSKAYWLKQEWNQCKINPNQDLPDQWSHGCNNGFQVICSCGNIWTPVFCDLTSGRSKSCGHFSQSEGEKQLGVYLEQLFPNQITTQDDLGFLKHQGVRRGNLKVDFANRNLTLAFEYDGEQHYKPVEYWGGKKGLERRQENDKRKEKLLKQNGYTLIRIRYDQDIRKQLHKALRNKIYIT